MEQGLQELTLRTGDIGDKRNFTHVKDVVNAYFLALQKIPPGELFLIGSESNENVATFEEVIGRLEKMSTLDKKIKIEPDNFDVKLMSWNSYFLVVLSRPITF